MFHAIGQRDRVSFGATAVAVTKAFPALKWVAGVDGDTPVVLIALALFARATHSLLTTFLEAIGERMTVVAGDLSHRQSLLKFIDIDMLAGFFGHGARGNCRGGCYLGLLFMSSNSSIKIQPRDRELLTSLDLSPFDARQLAKLSTTFTEPFTDEKFVRRRMHRLGEAGLVSHFHYHTDSAGTAKYYRLTREGYRFIAGPEKALPRRSYFHPVSASLQNHTRLLADFIAHTLTAASMHRVAVKSFYGENQLELKLAERYLRLDAAAQFKIKGYRPYNCLFELDCGTEPVYSTKQRESLSQKVRFIFDYERSCQQTFRHYVIFASSPVRMANYLHMVDELNPNRQRTICYATSLDRFLGTSDPFRAPIFHDHERTLASILPSPQMELLPASQLEESLEQQLAAV